jgi:hypothetical protein
METLTITASSGQASMDWLSFVVELLHATAWPIAAVVIAVLFRRQIRDLLSRVRKGKIGPAEFEFEQVVRELVQEVAPVPSAPVEAPHAALATTNPRAAILEVWIELEAVMNRIAIAHGIDARRGRSSLYQVRMLHKTGAITDEDVALFNDLRALRNQAAHDEAFSPSIESVVQYMSLAAFLIARLKLQA